MRILQIVNIGYAAGGAETSVELIREMLVQRGHDVLVIATDKQLDKGRPFADVVIPRITGNPAKRFLNHAWYGAGKRDIEFSMKCFNPDVVHLHTIGEFSPSVFWAIGRAPSLLTVHGPEEYTLKLLPWHLPASDYRNQSYARGDLKPLGHLRYWYERLLQRRLYLLGARRLRAILAPSKFMAGLLAADAGRVPVRQLYNGIELPSARLLPGRPSVLYVGRLESYKGVEVLLRAMVTLRQFVPLARLVVVGDGSQRRSLEKLSAALGLDGHVRFTGWVGAASVAGYYEAAQVLAIPSLCPENLPTVAIEAMAVGRPIVGSNVGGIPELVADGVTGRIVEPRDADGLAAALREILSDSELAERMSAAARDASQTFGAGRFVDALERVYLELAG
jgi:glycosyltransferase involved in cell wall biosynthesis